MHIEEVLGFTYAQACLLQTRQHACIANRLEKQNILERMLAFAAPEIPEYATDTNSYSTVSALYHRLLNESRASIIATNPPMATGFLANHVLFHLLIHSPIKREFISIPPMPGYLMFDAALHICKRMENAWWDKNSTNI
jgi:hypothetical protein